MAGENDKNEWETGANAGAPGLYKFKNQWVGSRVCFYKFVNCPAHIQWGEIKI
jgi:hypothetical protein